jgi:hypothetical protein
MDLRWRSPADSRNVDNLALGAARGVGAGTGSPLVADMRYDATELMTGLTEVLCYATAVMVRRDSEDGMEEDG